MTVESRQRKIIYHGNGAAREFPVPFKYNRPADLYLLHTDTAGRETPITSNFRVNMNESGDTSVVYPVSGAPLPAGQRLTIYRNTPQTQIVDLINAGAFHPKTLEYDGFDRAVMMIQELGEALDRSIKVPISGEITPEELLADIFDARDGAEQSAREAANSAAESAENADRADAAADRAGREADRAEREADRAETAANKAEDIVGAGFATRGLTGY